MEFPTYAVLSIIEWKTYFFLFAKLGDCELKLTKKRFHLLVSKIRCFQLYRTKNVSRVTESKKRFCLFAASHPNKNLISLNQHFVCFRLSYHCLQHYLFANNALDSFLTRLRFFTIYRTKDMFGLLATKLNCFKPYVTAK